MKNYSLTITGVIISVAGTLLMNWFSESCTNEILTNAPLLFGGVMAWIGRVRQGDVNIVGVKR